MALFGGAQASFVELAREKENCKILKISQLKYFFFILKGVSILYCIFKKKCKLTPPYAAPFL